MTLFEYLDSIGKTLEKTETGWFYPGDLYLQGTGVTIIPENLTVGGYLDLAGTGITSLPEGLTVGGNIYLYGTGITIIPESLTVGGNIYLDWKNIKNYPFVSGCGDQNRTIYLQPGKWDIINIGCFRGTKEEAIEAIQGRYSGEAMEIYIQQVEACFQKGGK